MPAIHPPRLKIQTADLVQKALQPEIFCRSFHEFLNIYTDRTYRPGRVGEPPPLLRSYQVPKPVIRAVNKDLGKWAQDNRAEALDLADALWQESFLEFKLAAAFLIGQVEPSPVKPIYDRVEEWIAPNTEERLVRAVIYEGLARVLSEDQKVYIEQVDTWMRARKMERNRLGLKACRPLIDRKEFEDFPLIFKRLKRLMRTKNSPLRNDILAVLKDFADRAPAETALFLETLLSSAGDNDQIAWYARKSLDHFPADIRTHLRAVLVA
jgi:hypothetical protein